MIIDEKDLRVLEELKQNSKRTTQQLAKKLNIPITTIHNRIKKMEKQGLIKGYTVMLDHKKLDKPILSYILVTAVSMLPTGKKILQEDVAQSIKKLPVVEEVSIMTGGTDILIKARLKDVDELNDFLIKKLRRIDGVDKTQTMIVLSSV